MRGIIINAVCHNLSDDAVLALVAVSSMSFVSVSNAILHILSLRKGMEQEQSQIT